MPETTREQNAQNTAALYGGFCATEQSRYLLCVQQYDLEKNSQTFKVRVKRLVTRWIDVLRETPLGGPLKKLYWALKRVRRKFLRMMRDRKRR